MKHFYESIPGWFTFHEFYSKMVKRFPSGSEFLEIGTYAGRSFAYLAVEIINSKKNIELIGIDGFGWQGLKEDFDRYMTPVKNRYFILKGNSLELAVKFPNESLDFIFIDANHTYEDVKADILAYIPKVKKGGVLGGHDYCDGWPGVVQAVNEIFGDKKNVSEKEVSWWAEL